MQVPECRVLIYKVQVKIWYWSYSVSSVRWRRKTSTVGAIIASWGRLFHCLTVRGKKDCICCSVLESGMRYPYGCAVRVGLVIGWMYCSMLKSTSELCILYNMVSLRCSLLFSSEDQPSCSSISDTLEVLWYRFSTYLAALLWIISNWCMHPAVWGSHTVHPYSTRGRTRVW